jgi:hypothetical protein
MSIAEQMGRTLQRTAVSTNIKERLDFSCALFGCGMRARADPFALGRDERLAHTRTIVCASFAAQTAVW